MLEGKEKVDTRREENKTKEKKRRRRFGKIIIYIYNVCGREEKRNVICRRGGGRSELIEANAKRD